LAVAAAFVGTPAAEAEEIGATAPEGFAAEPWVVQVTPYLWAAGIDGDVSPFEAAPSVHFEKTFSDILDDLNFAGFVNLWARNGRFVFSGDLMYVDTIESRAIGSLPIIGPTPGVKADVDTAMFVGTVQGGYRVYSTPDLTLDVLAGARGFHLSNEVTVDSPIGSASRSFVKGWVDPVVSARLFYAFTERFSVLAQGDVGGFGVGSDLTWQLLSTVNWTVGDSVAVSAGYKVLSVDYDQDGFIYDTTLSGPVLGVTYRF
jgi:hypothetical protein